MDLLGRVERWGGNGWGQGGAALGRERGEARPRGGSQPYAVSLLRVAAAVLELAGHEDLVRAPVQAIWLSETGASLGSSLRDVLNVDGEDPSLELLPAVLRFALRTRRIIRQNILWSLVYNLSAIPLALLGFRPRDYIRRAA